MIIKVPYYSQFKDTKNPDWKNKACGIAALKMVLDFYNPTNLLIDELYQKGLDLNYYLEDVGWYHYGLINIAQTLGFKGIIRNYNILSEVKPKLSSYGFKEADIKIMKEQLLEEGLFTIKQELNQKHPVIVAVPRGLEAGGSGHLIVFIGFDEDSFYFNDPDDEKRPGEKLKVSYEYFRKIWTHRAIFISK